MNMKILILIVSFILSAYPLMQAPQPIPAPSLIWPSMQPPTTGPQPSTGSQPSMQPSTTVPQPSIQPTTVPQPAQPSTTVPQPSMQPSTTGPQPSMQPSSQQPSSGPSPSSTIPPGGLRCQPLSPCWPPQSAIDNITQLLNFDSAGYPILRSYWWNGPGTPYPGPVGVYTNDINGTLEKNQPLYGAGKSLKGFYVRNFTNTNTCFVNNYTDEFCLVSMRNNPMADWQPAFVGFPVNTSHVQLLVNFARTYNLSLCVLGTGHDFLNRHSCMNGLLIRTSLLKGVVFHEENNTMTVGSGFTLSEAHYYVSFYNRMVVSGWSPTVGIAGWSFGGGHGPYNTRYGLGADNLVELEIVNSEGNTLIANNHTNKDLWLAIRGGGGDAFGVVTAITLQTHPLPANGFTITTVSSIGDFCTGEQKLLDLIDAYLNWTLERDTNWGGLAVILTNSDMSKLNYTMQSENCTNGWLFVVAYHYWGSKNDTNFTEIWSNLVSSFPKPYYNLSLEYPTPWAYFNFSLPEQITPVTGFQPNGSYAGGTPSVLISRDKVQATGQLLHKVYKGCNNRSDCKTVQIFQDLTGNINSPHNPDTSVNPGMRNGIFHLIFGDYSPDQFYKLGNYSYFGECAYNLPNWQSRLWGPNYPQLLETKKKYDPIGLFACRHCVGDQSQ